MPDGGNTVTILILLETPLQSNSGADLRFFEISHNPYFTGNSFAIQGFQYNSKGLSCHNPYFTGNSFAIRI